MLKRQERSGIPAKSDTFLNWICATMDALPWQEVATSNQQRRVAVNSARFSTALLLITATCQSALAEPLEVGTVGPAVISYDAAKGLAGLTATIEGIRFQPLAGAAALNAEGKPDFAIPLQIQATVAHDVLRIVLTTDHTRGCGIDPGLVQGLGEWRRLDLSRYAEPFGQTWWPKTTYSVQGDFWFTAHWLMEESNGTSWKAVNERNRGSEPFPAALRVEYKPDIEGQYLPICEVLELRFSKDLWDVVPTPRQKPSEYRDFLRRSVFVDLWGGNPADRLHHMMKVLKAIGREDLSFYTILQNWETGGWDALLPDSMWLPEYPPNPGIGSVEELRSLCELGKSMGRFGFRTNYRILRESSPSYRLGLAQFASKPDGTRLDYLRCADWLSVASRGDGEIRDVFAPNACFTDQMTSGAAPWSWHDFASKGGSRCFRQTLSHQRALARQMKEIFRGPLGSETLIDQHLFGEFVDTGDYGIQNGHARLFSPEFKLRRLQHLSGFHGMGLMYRFYEPAPFDRFHSGTTTFQNDLAQLDDYRACEILYGNGGYLCHDFANWQHYLTECLLVGHLQQHYSGCPVRNVRYRHRDNWFTLDEFVRKGNVPNIIPWNPQTEAYGLVWVEYENGLNVVVNRLAPPHTVADTPAGSVVLPKSGWVAWKNDGTVCAFSAYWPGTEHRVDYLRDTGTGLTYIDPRGRTTMGVDRITLFDAGKVVLTTDADLTSVVVDGKRIPLDLPPTPPLTSLNFQFEEDFEGWRPTRGVLRAEAGHGTIRLDVAGGSVSMRSPPLKVSADEVSAIEVRMRVQAETLKSGGLYFTTVEHPNVWTDRLIRFDVIADGEFHIYKLNVSAHPKWRGQTITGLRLDPLRGTPEAKVEIDSIHGSGEMLP